MAEHDVTLTGAAPVVLAALRERVDPGRPDVLSESFERLFATLSGRLTMAAVAPVGPAWNLYHRTRDAAMTVAAALPVAADAALPAGVEPRVVALAGTHPLASRPEITPPTWPVSAGRRWPAPTPRGVTSGHWPSTVDLAAPATAPRSPPGSACSRRCGPG